MSLESSYHELPARRRLKTHPSQPLQRGNWRRFWQGCLFLAFCLVFVPLLVAQADQLKPGEEIGAVRIDGIERLLSAIDVYGEVRNTDELGRFAINGIPVTVYNRKFQHRVYLKAGIQPLAIRVGEESKTFVESSGDSASSLHDRFTEAVRRSRTEDQEALEEQAKAFRRLIEKDPYSVKFHRAYVEASNQKERIIRQYEEWFDSAEFSGTSQLPNVCLVYFAGYAYELAEEWELARIKYQETLWLDEYFAPAHLGLAKYYRHRYDKQKRDPDEAWRKALEHCQLAKLYNYNDVFYVAEEIGEFYNEILKAQSGNKSLYAGAYLSRSLFHPSIRNRIRDVAEYQIPAELPELSLAKAYLSTLKPERWDISPDPDEDRLSKQLAEVKAVEEQISKLAEGERGYELYIVLGDVYSTMGDYFQKSGAYIDAGYSGLADNYYKRALTFYYGAGQPTEQSTVTYCEAIIQLHRDRDPIRGDALLRIANWKAIRDAIVGKDVEELSRLASLLREALLCFTDERKRDNIRERLDEIYRIAPG